MSCCSTRLAQHEEAAESYRQAIATYNEALGRAPNDVDAHNNKGVALASLGLVQAGLSQHDEAMNSLQAALAEFSRSLEIAPGDRRIRDSRDRVRGIINELRGR